MAGFQYYFKATANILTATAGIAEVKVTAENGPILSGDYLALSKTAGFAAKAVHSGQVIGRALEPFDGTVAAGSTIRAEIKVAWQNINNIFVLEDTQITGAVGVLPSTSPASYIINQNGSGNILQLQAGGADRFLVATSGAISILANASTTQNLLTVQNGSSTLLTIDSVGNLKTTGHIIVGKDSAGTATIKAGDNQTTVTFDIPYAKTPKIVVTVNGVPNFFYGVINKSGNGFTVAADRAMTADMTFDWVALEQDQDTSSQSSVNLQVISSSTTTSGSGGGSGAATQTTSPATTAGSVAGTSTPNSSGTPGSSTPVSIGSSPAPVPDPTSAPAPPGP